MSNDVAMVLFCRVMLLRLEMYWRMGPLAYSLLPCFSKGRHERYIVDQEKFDAKVGAEMGNA